MEYQPNGDGTTEGQAIHILGYLHAYLATNDPIYLDKTVALGCLRKNISIEGNLFQKHRNGGSVTGF